MAEKQTGKYVKEVNTRIGRHNEVTGPLISMTSDKDYGDKNFSMIWEPITQPFLMVEELHKHDFDQFLCFIGTDTSNLKDLGGEVELTLSEDGKAMEKHVITSSTTVFIPEGLYHAPLDFKKVDKPFLFINIYFTQDYKKLS